MNEPLVSVVIVNWNKKSDLKKAIESIYDQTYQNIEIIVVDNHSTDGSIEMVQKDFLNVKLIIMPDSDYGACETINIGMVNTVGEFVVVMDNDAILEKDWIELAVKNFNENDKIGAIGSKVVNYYSKKAEWYHARPVEEWQDKEFKTSQFHGAAAAFRKSVLDEVGYYPKEYFLYENEFALGAKIINAGYDVIYCPNVVAYHKATYKTISKRVVYYGTRNKLWNALMYLPAKTAINSGFKVLVIDGSVLIVKFKGRYIKSYLKALIVVIFMSPKILVNRQAISTLGVIDYPPTKSWSEIWRIYRSK
ncbi:MAG: glycosyltransferase family 2 protein [Halobacteriota archaeon]